MTRWLLPFLAATVALCSPATAQQALDTGWELMTPEAFLEPSDYQGVIVDSVEIWERKAVQHENLAVITLIVDFRNQSGLELHFDYDIIAVDAAGEPLFVFKLSPTLYGVDDEASQRLKQTRYVMPGTLARVARYRGRYVGVAPD